MKDRFYVFSDDTGRFVCKSKITGKCYYVTPNCDEGTNSIFKDFQGLFRTSDNWMDYNELIGYGTNPIQEAIDADIEFEEFLMC